MNNYKFSQNTYFCYSNQKETKTLEGNYWTDVKGITLPQNCVGVKKYYKSFEEGENDFLLTR